MHKYTDINKKELMVNRKGLIPYRHRKKKTNVNYQVRYYFLIFFFIFISFSYISFKIFQDQNNLFKEIYTALALGEKDSTNSQNKISSNKPQTLNQKKKELNNPSTKVSPQLNEKTISFYLPQFYSQENSINFIPIPQTIAFQSRNDLLKKIFKKIVGYDAQDKSFRNFFSSQIKLKGALIENETLILNFNRFIEISKYGYKGIDVRLQQIFWTLFNLDKDILGESINYISILIEGERKEKLGGDGIILKPFYSKQDLKNKIFFYR